ncbi:MAG: histidine kinase, partial [Candidatus Zixiibacteriota bacterium]
MTDDRNNLSVEFDRLLTERGVSPRFHEFQRLIPHRVRDILLVASLYDSYVFEEEGRLYEGILSEYVDLNLSNAPNLVRAPSGKRGLEMAAGERHFDLIIVTRSLGDMDALTFAVRLREAGITTPLVLLTYDNRELGEVQSREELSLFEWVFVWQGDFRILIAIIKLLEDRLNVEHDTRALGVQSIIVIEDNAAFYSSFLPLIYTEVIRHHQHLISDSVNTAHRLLRMRARPKILLCTNYEEAMRYYRSYEDCILGIISDVEFPREGKRDRQAGLRFAREVKASHLDVPILLNSDNPDHEREARRLQVSFLYKSSPLFMHELTRFIVQHFAFGDFVFRAPDGRAVGRAADLRALEEQLAIIPDEILKHHAERNHFSYWLKARTEFYLADKLRPQRVTDYKDLGELRQHLLNSLRTFRRERELGLISDFDPRTFVAEASFSRIGGGSLGGKARGLAFMAGLLNNFDLRHKFENVEITVPPAVVLGTDIFEEFMDNNDLSDFAIQVED